MPACIAFDLTEGQAAVQSPPVELLPWLMMAVLVVLTVESLLANRFYRRAAPAMETGAITGEPGA